MGKSIKLKNNTYWDNTAIHNIAQKISFSMGNGFTLNCDGDELVMLVAIRGTLGSYCDVMILDTYSSGTILRSHVTSLISSGYITVEIVDKKFIFTTSHPEQSADCGIIFLVGNDKNVTLSR